MNNYFYMNYAEGQDAPMVKHKDKEVAEKEATRLANKLNKKVYVLKSCSMTTPNEINVKVNSFEAALEYLGRKSSVCMYGIADKHKAAMMAMYKLTVIAEAWNKADKFIPDFGNTKQLKWNPVFKKLSTANFIYAYTHSAATYSRSDIGSQLWFSTSKRAEQFGKQFIDLWNDFLL